MPLLQANSEEALMSGAKIWQASRMGFKRMSYSRYFQVTVIRAAYSEPKCAFDDIPSVSDFSKSFLVDSLKLLHELRQILSLARVATSILLASLQV